MQRINLFYWHGKCPNLGDEASPYIIGHLSTCSIRRQGLPLIRELKKFLKDLLNFHVPTNFKNIVQSIGNTKKYIVGLGSVIQYSSQSAMVWGAGFQNPQDTFGGGTVLAVRGPLTDDELMKRGYNKCGVYGDPGLLMPLIYQPKITPPHFDFGIIPHFEEIDYIKEMVKDKRIKVIDFRTANIEEAINSILDCKIIVSSSLHGVIFSQAYGILAILFQSFHTSKWQFKNRDYLESVSIAPYEPIFLDSVDFIDIVLLGQIYNRYKQTCF